MLLLLMGGEAQAQNRLNESPPDTPPTMPGVALDDVQVAPTAIDTKEWLLLNKDIQIELDGAVHNLYNFKFDKAEKQFRSLRRRYPEHPMPYFLLGLSTWWHILPSNTHDEQYDNRFYAYLDTAITKAKRLYNADHKNYEACFFLAASYGFEARLHAERRDWRKATFSSKRSLTYLQKSREANGLSPEFAFGEGLFNYYAVWIGEEYPLLRPVLLFFPKGNRATGFAQLNEVGKHGFYTGTEARYFQMCILASDRENKTDAAQVLARALCQEFPDNPCFARAYASSTFVEGDFSECERISRDILSKSARGLIGYEAYTGRAASYYMGWLMQNRYNNKTAARDFYMRSVVFSEVARQTNGGYYLFSLANLGRLAAQNRDVTSARRYFELCAGAGAGNKLIKHEARTYLRDKRNALRGKNIDLTVRN